MGLTTHFDNNFDSKIAYGELEKYKTRLSALDNQQIAGIHFN
jgi:hypothetical protein